MYGAELGFEDIEQPGSYPVFHTVSQNVGPGSWRQQPVPLTAFLVLGLDCAQAVLSAPEGVGQRFSKELPRTRPSEQQSWGK